MGVDISWGPDGHYHMSYTSFSALQGELAAAIGIELIRMEGHGGAQAWEGIKDPLAAFLRQSCDGGKLSPQDCLVVRRRIWEVTHHWPPPRRESMRNFASFFAEAAFLGQWLRWS
jgi:hypothetical protein